MLDPKTLREAVRHEGGVSRRLFLAYAAALAGFPLLADRARAQQRSITFDSYPFFMGVASGDPDSTSVVLWTRLAPLPLQPDGGMPPEAVPVSWEVAEDERMSKVVKSGTATATSLL